MNAPPARRGARALAAAALLLLPNPAAAAPPTADAHAAALRSVAALRAVVDPAAAPVSDSVKELVFRGRPSLEIKGRQLAAEAPGPVRDFSVWDLGTARIAVFVYFPHASARQAGEPIISLSEISTRADAHLGALLPRSGLVLEGIQRFRASGQESVYYEARYAPPGGDIPFLEPPVRLLLDASTGEVFRFDLDPEWLSPPAPPTARISRQAAERIAAVALSSRDLAPFFGEGARPGKVAAAELFYVRPNDWLGFHEPAVQPGTRVAWVVPFVMEGEASRGTHSLYVDAATGHVLGGAPGGAATGPSR